MSYHQFRPMRWQILPPVVKNLLIINGILFLATIVLEDKFGLDLTRYLGLHFVTSEFFGPHQYITHLFMHGSWLHIFSNMFALWMFGNILENLWGGKRFLVYYLVTGIGAAIIHTFFTWYEISRMQEQVDVFISQANPVDFKLLVTRYQSYLRYDDVAVLNDFLNTWAGMPSNPALIQEAGNFAAELITRKADIPTVGASGAVFGVLLAFGMLFPNTIIYIYFALPIKAKWFVILYGLFELYSGLQNNPGDNVAHFAHLGGMLFGYLLIRSWKKNRFTPYQDDY
ncbi:MAG: rhomboid family intramembrane serine protease [Bacteroidia bacterium]|nr:rhomboid family intramembrane serine protease [Bacteroidia bacterium]